MSPVPNSGKRNATKKRKSADGPAREDALLKKPRPQAHQPQKRSLISPHETILAELNPKYNVLPASVISSTKIQKRVSSVTAHLLATSDKPAVGLLYARTADVCKLITIVEHCKRVLAEEGKPWYQYNQLFDLPDDVPNNRDVVEETVLEETAGASDSDDFEVMESRFEKAVLPFVSKQVAKSLRIFISNRPVAELKLKDNVTLQSSEGGKSSVSSEVPK